MTACTKTEPQLGKSSVKRVVAAMTLEEKAMLVVGTGMFFEMPALPDSVLAAFPRREEPEVDSAYQAMLDKIRKLVPGAAGRTVEISRLGIPTMVVADGPAGLRISPNRNDDPNTYYCTAFPIATLLASSWDVELVHKVGEAMGNEVLEYGADVILGPGMNINRNPLCGRNFEYYSEDPLITGKMAAAMVNGIQSQGVGTSVKHFAANNQETNRNIVNTIVSERALREIYLEGFRIVVEEAQPWTVMSSYNKINGPYASESYDLLTKILREDWGFQGYVVTDWGGGSDAVAQMRAGNDLLMPGQVRQSEEIIKAVQEGTLDEGVLDQNVERILNIILKTPRFKGYAYSDKPDLAAHAEVARQAGVEGMVLLKNRQGALPLEENIKSIAAFGNTSYEIITGGTGSGDVNEAYSVSLVQGLENGGFSVDESLQNEYMNYMREARANQPRRRSFFRGPDPIPEMEIKSNTVRKLADIADVALITIGRNSGEGSDRSAEPGDFYLTDTEKSLIQAVSQEFQSKGKKAIVVLNIGGVIEVASWRDFPDAILLAWQPGQETGNAIVDVIRGKVNPSGKLTSTFPISYDDVPSAENFPGIETPDTTVRQSREGQQRPFRRRILDAEVVYEEDIYVGYRYYNTFNVPVAYEFGYGLSYTQFEYGNIQVSSAEFDDQLTVSVDITNAGTLPGREVVQVYLSTPAEKLDKPAEELIAFGKTGLLGAGESQTMSFTINQGDLASYDEASSSWIAEAGTYEIKIGASSKDIRQTAEFNLGEELIVKKVNKVLVPEREIDKMHP
ncbi:MAG: glycoside hydrolase [Bacteroides sp. SM23_62_1]|nr:MAG: glycoside hydrolase [Bacteroides sp. SM23_62_1]